MDCDEFKQRLTAEGFSEVMMVERAPNGSLDVHTHPFEARAIVLEGEIRLCVGDKEEVCRPGDTFHLAAHQAHAESYGPQGVKYLVGRR